MNVDIQVWVDAIGKLFGAFSVILVLGFGQERISELSKQILRKIGTLLSADWMKPYGVSSWMLAIVPAFLIAFGFEVNVLDTFDIFAEIDPDLVRMLSMFITWGVSNAIHPRMPSADGK